MIVVHLYLGSGFPNRSTHTPTPIRCDVSSLFSHHDQTPEKSTLGITIVVPLELNNRFFARNKAFRDRVRENRGLCGRTVGSDGLKAIAPANCKESIVQQPKFLRHRKFTPPTRNG